MKVPKSVVKQIQYLCYNIPDNEWSGPIMYRLIGNFATGNFHCVVKDLYLMAKGSSAYTEYEFGEDFIKYRMAHPESLEWEVGNCHSHNNMATFFSGTDINDLQENSLSNNYYLSLIVNNNLDTTAKISFVGEQEVKQNIVKSFFGDNGKLYKFNTKEIKKEKVLFVYNCIVELDHEIKVNPVFKDRVDEIIAKYEAGKAAKTTTQTFGKYNNGGLGYTQGSLFPGTGMHDDFEDTDMCYFESEATVSAKEFTNKHKENTKQLLVDSLLGEFGAKSSLDEAMFKANVDFKENPENTVNTISMFLQTLGDQYLPETKLNTDEYFETLAELIYFYESEFPEFCDVLTDAILEEV